MSDRVRSAHVIAVVFAFIGFAASNLYAGANRWTKIMPPDAEFLGSRPLAIDPTDTRIVYVDGCTSNGDSAIWRTTDGGESWNLFAVVDRGSCLSIFRMEVQPSTGDLLVLTFSPSHAVYRFNTLGNIVFVRAIPLESGWAYDIAADPTNAETWYVGGSCTSSTGPCGVCRTTDGGKSWRRIISGNFNGLTIDPHDGQVLYASAYSDLFRSLNGGATWTNITPTDRREVDAFVIDPVVSSTIYASDSSALWVSDNRGDTWVQLTSRVDPALTVTSLAVDPSNRSTLVAVGHNGASRSIDGGRSFLRLNRGLGSGPTEDEYVCCRYSVAIDGAGRIYSTGVPMYPGLYEFTPVYQGRRRSVNH